MQIEPRTIPVYAVILAVGILGSAWVFQADLNRRKIQANAYWITIVAGAVGLVPMIYAFRVGLGGFAALVSWFLMLAALAPRGKTSMLEFFDAGSVAAAAGIAATRLGILLLFSLSLALRDGAPTAQKTMHLQIYVFLAWLGIAALLWRIGTKATLGPKPRGEIFSIYLVLDGLTHFVSQSARPHQPYFYGLSISQTASLFTFLAGGILLGYVHRQFHALSKEHRILQHVAVRGEILQPEYRSPTPECPHPERWRMYDSMTAEVEVLDFLKTLVTTIKPELVVETGTFLGISTLHIAEGLRENGFGRVITCEFDPKVFEEAKKRFQESGLGEWIDLRNESSLEIKIEGRIDLLYCDSDLPLREQEVRRFLPQVNPNGLILMHDASSSLKTVREAAQKLEREGLLSIVLLPTPRGLVIGQKREGRA